MAVGPDSFDEAIEVWSSASPTVTIPENIEDIEIKSGTNLLNKILSLRYPIENNENNIFIHSLVQKEEIHIYDSWQDDRVIDEIKELMDVKEFVIIPLIVGNRSIGIIVADNKFNQSPIGNDSIELLSIFASQAALSIESYSNLEIVRNEMEKISKRQDALLESEKLAAVGRVASHISHEIRNPLVTMGGYAGRIIQLAKNLKNEGIISAAKIILKESERLEKTLSNVMDFTRPTKYIKDFNSINEVVGDTIDLLKNVLLEKRIEVDLTLNPDLPLIKSDFNQLKQVMLNLIQNAMDSISDNGKIHIISEIKNEFIVLSIADNGSGIEHNDPNVIFEPFFTTKVTGVGLGLAIVKKIIKDHNGDIEVQKSKSGGVKFIIKLPMPA
jgi:signal transduction histidine kinase